MEQSDAINELAAALATAQGQMTGALKDSANPYFKSKYADLASCWDACRKPLSENGLAVIQTTSETNGGTNVVTTLAHSSGQWIRGSLPVKIKDDSPQAQGSGLTYARRYALASMVGIAQIDDDAEAAQGRKILPQKSAEVLTAQQQQKALFFADAFRAELNRDEDEYTKQTAILQLRDDANTDQLVFTGCWGMLDANERRAIKEYIVLATKRHDV